MLVLSVHTHTAGRELEKRNLLPWGAAQTCNAQRHPLRITLEMGNAIAHQQKENQRIGGCRCCCLGRHHCCPAGEGNEPSSLETAKHKVKVPRAGTVLTPLAVQTQGRVISAAVTAQQQGQRGHQFQLFCFTLSISGHMF